jgi:prophage antirepressor-like protein
MKNTLMEFSNTEWRVRSSVIGGAPVFVGKDVCSAVHISKYRDALAKLDADELVSMKVDTSSANGVMQSREMIGVTESGLYALVFQSRKPEARAFRRWVTGEVLPAIRLTGEYRMRSIDPQRLAEIKGELAATQKQLERQTDYYWSVRHIDGHVSVSAFLRAAGVKLTWKSGNAHLSSRCRHHCMFYRIPIGAAEQCRDGEERPRSGRHGWTEVSTYPPEVIAEELRGMDVRFSLPAPEAVLAAHATLSRPRAGRPLALPVPTADLVSVSPTLDVGTFPLDFGHGAEVHA